MSAYLMGIDIGTSACKAALFTAEGACVASAEISYGMRCPQPGWTEQDPEDWWQAAVSGIRVLLSRSGVQASEICGIGIDGQSWAMIPLDKEGGVLYPSPLWTDTRAQTECGEMKQAVGKKALFQCGGNPVMPGYTLPKVLWFRKHYPDLYARTEKVLQSNSYIVYKLTGRLTQDVSQGYGWHCFDSAKGQWDTSLAEALGLKPSLLPDIQPCSAIVGGVSPEAAKITGLIAGTPVAAGGLDAACSTLGAGVIHNGQTQEQGGQAGGMSICMDAYAASPALILSQHVVPGRWLLQGGTTGGGGALKWFREQFCPDMTFEQMSDAAEEAPVGSGGVVFLPYMSGERSPIWNPYAKGVFFGMSYSTTRAQMIRAVMEGVAFSLRHNLDTAAAAGRTVDRMRATGGSSKSAVWTQIKADVTGCRMDVPEANTSAVFGAAILAGIGTGVYSSWDEAVKGIRVTRQFVPDPESSALYEKQYQTYLQLIAAASPLMTGDEPRERSQKQ